MGGRARDIILFRSVLVGRKAWSISLSAVLRGRRCDAFAKPSRQTNENGNISKDELQEKILEKIISRQTS